VFIGGLAVLLQMWRAAILARRRAWRQEAMASGKDPSAHEKSRLAPAFS
jgi:hypothetical protein